MSKCEEMHYMCIEDFVVDLVDGDGFLIEEDSRKISKGSIWWEHSNNVSNGYKRLDNEDNGWVELDEETFNRCFKLLECDSCGKGIEAMYENPVIVESNGDKYYFHKECDYIPKDHLKGLAGNTVEIEGVYE